MCDLISMLSQVAANVRSYCLNFESSFETERARFLLCWLSDSGKREKTLGLSQGKLIELGLDENRTWHNDFCLNETSDHDNSR